MRDDHYQIPGIELLNSRIIKGDSRCVPPRETTLGACRPFIRRRYEVCLLFELRGETIRGNEDAVMIARRARAAERARELLARLERRQIDLLAAADVGRRIFSEVGDDARSQWLSLELNGYGNVVMPTPLRAVMRLSRSAPLVRYVTTYRHQRGIVENDVGQVVDWRHFFVESLWDLIVARRTARDAGTEPRIALAFQPPNDIRPKASRAWFSRDVFERILDGFGSALYLELSSFSEEVDHDDGR